jgi:para-aminobenzoate synthetase component 2
MILVIDNYDSFVYNLARYFEILGSKVVICRNNQISIQDIQDLNPKAIIISPGPCSPLQAGLSIDIVRYFYKTVPILGVCLGHQVIGHVFGGIISYAKEPLHGKSSKINIKQSSLFQGLPEQIVVGRYHSLIVNINDDNQHDLRIIATSNKGEVMAIEITKYKVYGVQFHPESILTEYGFDIIRNFINLIM